MEEFNFIQQLEVIDVVGFINKKTKLHQKLMLDELEAILGKNSDEFKLARKVVLDKTSDYARSVVRMIFGDDFEGIIK